MRLPESGFGRGDVAGLAITLARTFGIDALTLVDEQVSAAADPSDLRSRWVEVRNALAILTDANTHMEAALTLLDQIEESSVPPMLDHAIVQLGFRDSKDKADSSDVTVAGCSGTYLGDRVQDHLKRAQFCGDPAEKVRHLNAASTYATLRQQIVKTIRPDTQHDV